jgi:hypothetical protein
MTVPVLHALRLNTGFQTGQDIFLGIVRNRHGGNKLELGLV